MNPRMVSTRLLSFPTRALPMVVAQGAFTKRAVGAVQTRGYVRKMDVHDVGHTNVGIPMLTRAMMSTNSVLRLANVGHRMRLTTGRVKCMSHPAGRASVVFINLNVLIKNLMNTLAVRLKNVPVDLSADKNTLVTNLLFK